MSASRTLRSALFNQRRFIEHLFVQTLCWVLGSCCCSVAKSCPTLLLQHTRLPCPSPSPSVCSNSFPLSQWCHLTSSSVGLFSSCLQSFPASGSFPMSQLFPSCSQSIGVSASASVFPVNIKDWFSLGLTDLISLQPKGLSRVFSSTTVQKYQFFGAQLSLWSNSYILTWNLEKPYIWLCKSLSAKQCLCFLIHCLGLS